MCKVKGSDDNSFTGMIFNWNDGDKIYHNFKDGDQLILKIFIYFTMVGPGNKTCEDCVKEKKTRTTKVAQSSLK